MHNIIFWIYWNIGQIGRQTTELAAFEHPKILPFYHRVIMRENGVNRIFLLFTYLRTIRNIFMTSCSQVSDVCPLGYLLYSFFKPSSK